MRIAFSLLTALLLFGPAYSQATSIYTSTRASACKTVESSAEGSGWYIGECRGAGGYKVQLLEGDLRQTLNVITPARKKLELNLWDFYSSFSSVGEKIEWRMRGRSPIALIVRFVVSDPENSQKGRSYLVVAKVGLTEACVTDIVAPGSGQNEEARQLADVAGTRPCRRTGQ
jgi:hypothetical protein